MEYDQEKRNFEWSNLRPRKHQREGRGERERERERCVEEKVAALRRTRVEKRKRATRKKSFRRCRRLFMSLLLPRSPTSTSPLPPLSLQLSAFPERDYSLRLHPLPFFPPPLSLLCPYLGASPSSFVQMGASLGSGTYIAGVGRGKSGEEAKKERGEKEGTK